jgi:UDP-3-O-[3-hydroxymyristoyl] glucosamine N-acyltransferase
VLKVIEFDVVIGARTVIYPSCVVSYDCHIGADCILKAAIPVWATRIQSSSIITLCAK